MREEREDGTTGFDFSVTNTPANNRLAGIIHSEQIGFELWNPTFRQGAVTEGEERITVDTVMPITLGPGNQEQSITITALGGGGGGGSRGDPGPVGATGGSTIVRVYHTSETAGNLIATVTGTGGTGGVSGNQGSGNAYDGTAGASTTFGAGGAAGRANSGSGTSGGVGGFGAGGGGGGGTDPGTFRESRNGGTGGNAAPVVVQNVDVSAFTGNILITVDVAVGGAGTGNGGMGGPGLAIYTSIFAGTEIYDLNDLINSGVSEAEYKTNLTQLTGAVDLVKQFTGYSFDYSQDTPAHRQASFGRTRDLGLLVEDVEPHCPEVVVSKNYHKRIRYSQLVPLLVEAIKEQQEQIDDLKAKMSILDP